jgi:hypothetical protein
MNGTAVASTGVVGKVPTIWSVIGTGDFNADGKTDILWPRHQRQSRHLGNERRSDHLDRRPRQRADHLVGRRHRRFQRRRQG